VITDISERSAFYYNINGEIAKLILA